MPGAEAPKGLGKGERQEKGLNGGVVRLVFIMAYAMPEGFQPTAGGAQMPDWMKADFEVSSTGALSQWWLHFAFCSLSTKVILSISSKVSSLSNPKTQKEFFTTTYRLPKERSGLRNSLTRALESTRARRHMPRGVTFLRPM